MRRLLVLVLAAVPANAAEPVATHRALVWQGFSHRFAARDHRAGDYIRSQSCGARRCTATLGHRAAWSSTYYAEVTSPDVTFLDGSVDIELDGSVEVTRTITVELPPTLRERGAAVLLNGFDLDGDAGRLRQLDIAVSDGTWDAAIGRLRFTVRVGFSGKAAALRVFYLVAGGNDFRSDVTEIDEVASSFSAATEPEAVNAVQIHVAPLPPAPRLAQSVMGVKQLHLHLDREHPIGAWDHFLRKSGYDPATGVVHYLTALFWKGAGRGQATLQLTPVVLRFRDACVRDLGEPHSSPTHEDAVAFGPACVEALQMASTLR
jgi:hypothetical protein